MVRADISAVDVLMMIKGVCESTGCFPHVNPDVALRQLDLVRGAIMARPDQPPLRGRRPTIEDLEQSKTPAAGPVQSATAERPSGGVRARRRPRACRAALQRRSSSPESTRRAPPAPQANSVGVVTTPARTPERKSRLTRSRTASLRRSASKRSRSSPSRWARAHRCGSSRRAWSANRESCISQKRPWAGRSLGGARGRPGAGMAGADREVAKDDAQRQPRQPQLERRAVRALEVRVDDHRSGRSPDPGRGHRRRGRDRGGAELAPTGPRPRRSALQRVEDAGWRRAGRRGTAAW